MPELNFVSTDAADPEGAQGVVLQPSYATSVPGYDYGGSANSPAGDGFMEFGSGTPGSLPFRVDQAGNVTAASVTGTNSVDWVNVVASYGADPTGAADSTAAINDALAAASSGTVVYLPNGVYKTSAPLTPQQGVILRGDAGGFGIPIGNYGEGGLPVSGTIIRPASPFTGTAAVLMTVASGQSGQQQLLDFTIDFSNLTGTPGTHGIQASSAIAAVKIRDVLVYGGNGKTTGDGLHVVAGSDGIPDFWDISHCKFSGMGGNGASLNGLADTYVVACEATGNTGWNWAVTNGNNTRFTACKGEGGGASGGGWLLTAASGFTGQVSFNGCTSSSNDLDGWQLNGPGKGVWTFTGCRANSDGATSGAAFTVQASFAGTAQFTGVATVPNGFNPAYGLKISSVSASAIIQVANSTLWGVTGGVSNDASTSHVLYDGNCVFTSGALSAPVPVAQPLPVAQGGTGGTSGGGMQLLESTGTGGYTLANGTATILTWTAPNDGAPHRVMLIADLHVTSAQTGGAVTLNVDFPDGFANAPSVFAGGQSPGGYGAFTARVVEPGSTVTVTQSSAMSAGAAVAWLELWGL